jgi:hypothetical protein
MRKSGELDYFKNILDKTLNKKWLIQCFKL